MPTLRVLFGQELLLAFRRPMDLVAPLLFFVLVMVLFPLAMGPRREQLEQIAPAAIWVAVLLAALLSLHRLFRPDAETGALDQLLTAPLPLELQIAVKVVVHWLAVGVPMLIVSPLFALASGVEYRTLPLLVATLALGTASSFLIGTVAEALTLKARNGGILMALLVLPLNVPIMIFGTTALGAQQIGISVAPHLSLLVGILMVACVVAPWIAAQGLRISLD